MNNLTDNLKGEDKPTPMMAQYLNVKKDYEDCLLFYRMGDFYELFLEDAVVAAKALDITLTKRGKLKGVEIPMCGVPFHAYENYMARLIKQGYKVAICEQVEDPKEAKRLRGHKAVVRREVVRIVTSGTLMEDNLLSTDSNNYLLSIYENGAGQNIVSWADISTGDFFVKTINEDLLAFILKITPSEIILPESFYSKENLKHIINDYKKIITYLPDERYNLQRAKDNLLKIFGVSDISSMGSFSDDELVASGSVLNYIEITQKSDDVKLKGLSSKTEVKGMELDAFTFNSLELLESMNSQKGDGYTLISVIDRTVSSLGARLLKDRIRNPLTDVGQINERLNAIDFFVSLTEARVNLRDVLRSIPDLERAVSRVLFRKAGPRDLYSILETVRKLPKIKIVLGQALKEGAVNDELKKPIEKILEDIFAFDSLEEVLGKALNEEKLPMLARDGGFIKDGYHPGLDEYKFLMSDSRKIIAEMQSRYSVKSGVSNLKIKHNNVIGYYIEVPAKSADPLMEDKENFIHRQTMANGVRFTTVELSDIEGKIREAEEKSLALELELFDELLCKIIDVSDKLQLTAKALAKLDVYSSLAELSVYDGYVKPVIDESGAFDIKSGRHPVVEYNNKQALKGDFIANDCLLENEKAGLNSKFWIITGPNMAGKSTFLRQNALIVLLSHIGCFVPAESAHIGVIDKLFSRVGASDNLAKGQSTFMVEMLETATILNKATDKSFVILDEIGRGTATFDGMSIAHSVVEYFNGVNNCRGLFATHYHELTALSEKLDNVSNHTMSIKEWKDEVVFMYKVIAGEADKSYGIHVAKIAGIPSAVVKRADQILKTLEEGEHGSKLANLSDELPLFSVAEEREEFDNTKPSEVEQKLIEANVDEMSAKDALDFLYSIKKDLD